MTVIAYRDGILASDSQVTCDGLKHPGSKLFRLKDCIVGVAGHLEAARVFVDWLDNRENRRPDLSSESDFAALVVSERGLEYWTANLCPALITLPFYAIGSGSHIAVGAMACGKSAKRAALIACQWADGCTAPVVTMSLKR